MPLYSYAYNLSHLSGAFGDRAVVPHKLALEMSAEEVEEVLARRALRNLDTYGHDGAHACALALWNLDTHGHDGAHAA